MAAKHAVLSASSSERWLNCPPSARLCEAYEDKGSDYAAEGTDAHALCEFRLKQALGIPADDPIENLSWYNEEMEDCAAGYQEGQAKLKGNGRSVPPLSAIKTPLRDGDIERPDDPAYAGAYFINANSATAPGIVDADRNPVLTRSEVYSGVYGRASINLYAFNSNGNKGIACGLNNLQLIRPGEPLGGKASAEADFATDDDEDFLG